MAYHNVVIAGGGDLGSQIILQTAYSGYNVKVWLRSNESIERTKNRIEKLKELYINDLEKMSNGTKWCNGLAKKEGFDKSSCLGRIQAISNFITYETDLSKAVENADLVIESIPEVLNTKKEFFKKLFPLVGENTVIATNSSTILPSVLAKGLKKEENLLGFHFAHNIHEDNIAEIMPSSKISNTNIADLMEFATNIGMISTRVSKEKAGYFVNSLLVPYLLCALDLYASGVGTPESIDTAWKISTHSNEGPFELLDSLGLSIVLDVVEQYQKVPGLISPLLKKMLFPYNFKEMKKILTDLVSQGKIGVASGEGFYKYNKIEEKKDEQKNENVQESEG